ncbi:MAG TPA: hypothetical protein VK029_04140 [Pseudogracilibacillus sp.]|nr:hypothetical protein [Pseudogracilibacillus sp.]
MKSFPDDMPSRVGYTLLEEKSRRFTKEAVQVAVERTGGVISSAGIILAATFAVLMTQPV